MSRPTAQGRRVLITGASAGIGAALARVYAEKGWDLILTARREAALEALASEIRTAHGVDVAVIAADLSESDAPERLIGAVAARGLTIDGLINNAGFSRTTGFLQTEPEAHEAMIRVMLTTPVALSRLVLPGMVERGFGRVINVASLAGQMPATGGDTLYGPIKSFLIKASQGLWLETRGTGVHVTALCPGYTLTEFHDVNGSREQVSSDYPSWMWQTAEAVVTRPLEKAGKSTEHRGMADIGPTFGLVGTGGFARETMPVARAFLRHHPELKIEPGRVVFVDRDGGAPIGGIPVLSQAEFTALDGERHFTVAIGDGSVRQAIAETLEGAGCLPLSIRADNVLLPDDLDCGPGALFAPFSMVTADAVIGRHFQCNLYAYVAHDCVAGDYVTFAPRVSLNGNVVVEDHVYVGTGAVIRQGTGDRPLVLGRGCVIGMGAVVTRDVAPGVTVVGNPARPLERP